jgi:arylmalonate decarboxylase
MTKSTRRHFLATTGATAAFGTLDAAGRTLGMIFPPANYQVPPEASRMYPTGIRFLAVGVGLERMTPAGYDKVLDQIVPAALGLARQGANAIALMGTSLSFYKGAAFNKQLAASIHTATGLPSTTMSNGIVQGLRKVGGKRIAVATAYNDEVNRRLQVFLEESGFEVLALKGLGIERFEDAPPVTQEGLMKFSMGVRDMAPQADAMLISCGALRTLELLAALEEHCKIPMVSSLPHALWAGVRLLGVSGKSPGFGTLLAKG